MTDQEGRTVASPDATLLRSLDQVGQRRRDGLRVVGNKALVLAKLARQGLSVPPAWVLDARHFDAFAERCLPSKHDLRSLIKLSGTKAGDERCARAHEQLLSVPLDEGLVAGIEQLWEQELAQLPQGVAVRPSLAATGANAWAGVRHLHSRVALVSVDEIVAAIREVWASAVLAGAVADYVQAQVKDVSVALLIQAVFDTATEAVLTRTTGTGEPLATADWHLGVVTHGARAEPWRRRAQLLVPLSLGEGAGELPTPLASLRSQLGSAGFEQVIDLGEAAERELGRSAVVRFAVEPAGAAPPRVHLLSVEESARWLPLSGGSESTMWVEISLTGRGHVPPTRVTQSIVDPVIKRAVESILASARCKVAGDAQLVSHWNTRSYLNLSALGEAVADLPLVTPEDVIGAVGGLSPEHMNRLAGRLAAKGRSRWRSPLVAWAALREQLRLDRSVAAIQRGIERDARGLGDMDLTLLPNDAMATTLTRAQTLLERAVDLWMQCTMAQLAHQVGLRAIVRRKVPDVDPQLGQGLTTGVGGHRSTGLAIAVGRVVDTLRADGPALAQIRAGEVSSLDDLPDGRARGAIGHLLSSWGDMSLDAFELSAPRWREDPADVMRMLALLVRAPADLPTAQSRQQQARAVAEALLARYEPELSVIERRLLRSLLDRSRKVIRTRISVDRLLLRALGALRRVVLDIDRRLQRLDPSVPPGGAFACSAARLSQALRSGRPELARVIAMRTAERHHQSREPRPPPGFVGAPPRGGIPIMPRATLVGVGGSPGVVEGRARVVRGALPTELEPGEVLVTQYFDPSLAPLCTIAGAVVAEVGGALSQGAEAARELSTPAVVSVQDAGLHIQDGERLRVDGDAGIVQRLDAPTAARGRPGGGAPPSPAVSSPALEAGEP
ncbi:MAG: hypothetical protein JRI68_00560 [Deltaproteobacteria bacterium]|nr:hypothetical protein [Deltaproteobacteria bacterium]